MWGFLAVHKHSRRPGCFGVVLLLFGLDVPLEAEVPIVGVNTVVLIKVCSKLFRHFFPGGNGDFWQLEVYFYRQLVIAHGNDCRFI